MLTLREMRTTKVSDTALQAAAQWLYRDQPTYPAFAKALVVSPLTIHYRRMLEASLRNDERNYVIATPEGYRPATLREARSHIAAAARSAT